MFDDIDPIVRKKIILIARIFLVVCAVVIVFALLRYGHISIDTQSDDTVITLRNTDGTLVDEKKRKLSRFNVVGEYVLSVSNKNGEISKNISINPLSWITEKITPPAAPIAATPVINRYVRDLNPYSSNLLFLDSQSRSIVSIDQQNSVTRFSPNDTINRVEWLSESEAYVLVSNFYSPKLYRYSSGIFTEIALNIGNIKNQKASIKLSQKNILYITIAGGLFRLNEKTNQLEKITTVPPQSEIGAVSENKFVIIEPVDDKSNPFAMKYVSLDMSGKKLGEMNALSGEGNSGILRISWSPDETKVAISGADGGIFDSQLKRVAGFPTKISNLAVWAKDGSILYTRENLIFKYDTKTNQSQSIVAIPTYSTVTELFVNQSVDINHGYLYFNISYGKGITKLYRVKLGAQPIKNSILDVLNESDMRTITSSCLINYVYNSQLSLIVQYTQNGDSNNDTAARSECASKVSDYLRDIGLDASKIDIKYYSGLNQL